MITHSLERTSPYGEEFVGKCVLCGREGLPSGYALVECPNPKNATQDEVLLNAIDPENNPIEDSQESSHKNNP